MLEIAPKSIPTQIATAPEPTRPGFQIRALPATGDFNGDGYADVLWRNAVTGEAEFWEMNGTRIIGDDDVGGAVGSSAKIARQPDRGTAHERLHVGSANRHQIGARGRFAITSVCETIGAARSNVAERAAGRPPKRRGRPPLPDDQLLAEIKAVIADMPTYGYARVWAVLRRQAFAEGRQPAN
jgi:hypothetical protein